MTIYQALNAVMRDVQAVRKGEKNTAPNGGFMFRGIDAVTNAVGPALREHGVIVAPRVTDWNYDTVTVGHKQTQMGHARVLIEFTWYGPEGDTLVTVAAGEAFDSGDKATAKAHSVAFRTCMIQTLCLPTDEADPDEQSYQRAEPPAPNPAAQARADLLKVIKDQGLATSDATAKFAADGHGELGKSTNVDAIRALIEHFKGAGDE